LIAGRSVGAAPRAANGAAVWMGVEPKHAAADRAPGAQPFAQCRGRVAATGQRQQRGGRSTQARHAHSQFQPQAQECTATQVNRGWVVDFSCFLNRSLEANLMNVSE
jgi:hypothetical protein